LIGPWKLAASLRARPIRDQRGALVAKQRTEARSRLMVSGINRSARLRAFAVMGEGRCAGGRSYARGRTQRKPGHLSLSGLRRARENVRHRPGWPNRRVRGVAEQTDRHPDPRFRFHRGPPADSDLSSGRHDPAQNPHPGGCPDRTNRLTQCGAGTEVDIQRNEWRGGCVRVGRASRIEGSARAKYAIATCRIDAVMAVPWRAVLHGCRRGRRRKGVWRRVNRRRRELPLPSASRTVATQDRLIGTMFGDSASRASPTPVPHRA